MSHFCVDNDSANHNQKANGLFSQSEEPKRDGCLGSTLAFSAAAALLSVVPGFFCSSKADLVFRCPPSLSSCDLSLCLSDRPTGPGAVEEIQSSEEALIHHTSPAACHLNAKYFHCIFKSKQEKKWAGGAEKLEGIKAYKDTIESAAQTLSFLIMFIFEREE